MGRIGLGQNTRRLYVYAISAPELKIFKIGKSHNPHHRFKVLKNEIPVELLLIGYVLDKSGGNLEIWLHAYLAGSRKRGEWFQDTPETLRVVEMIKNNRVVDLFETVRSVQQR